jgi:hypothetical protein
MARLETKTKALRATLEAVAESRLEESQALMDNFPAASIYLGGYVVECYLKVAICKTLDLAALPRVFESHALEALLMHSGLRRRMSENADVHDSFSKINTTWNMESDPIRYRPPNSFSKEVAAEFQAWLTDKKAGVFPWLKSQT